MVEEVEGVREGVLVLLGVAVGEVVWLAVSVADGVLEGVPELEGVTVEVPDGLLPRLGVRLPVLEKEGVRLLVFVPVPDFVGDTVCEGVLDVVLDGEAVRVVVSVAEGVRVPLGERVEEDVTEEVIIDCPGAGRRRRRRRRTGQTIKVMDKGSSRGQVTPLEKRDDR